MARTSRKYIQKATIPTSPTCPTCSTSPTWPTCPTGVQALHALHMPYKPYMPYMPTHIHTHTHTHIPTLGVLWGPGPEPTLQGPTKILMLLGQSLVCLYTTH